MTNDERLSISITLSPAQVDAVVRAATQSRAPSVSTIISHALRTPLRSGDENGSPASRTSAAEAPKANGRRWTMPTSACHGRCCAVCRCSPALGPTGSAWHRRDGARSGHEPEHGPPLRVHAGRARTARALPADAQVPSAGRAVTLIAGVAADTGALGAVPAEPAPSVGMARPQHDTSRWLSGSCYSRRAMFLTVSAPSQPDPALAATLRRMRVERGDTQEELAHRAGLTVAAFARIERGHANPTWTTVRRIAARTGGEPDAKLAEAVERSKTRA